MPPEAADALKQAQQGNPKLAESTVRRSRTAQHDPRARPFRPLARARRRRRARRPAAARRRARPRRLDGAGAARRRRLLFVFVALAFVCLALSFVGNDFSVLNVATNSNSHAAAALPLRRHLGQPRRLAAAVDADADGLDARGRASSAATCPTKWSARILGVMGLVSVRLPALHAVHLESVRAPAAGRRRRARPESAAAGPGHGDPSADALHGLRRLLGRVRVRHRGAARRQPRRDLGALVAAVDHGGLDASSPSASRSAAAGPTTSSAGAAGGSGIRSRTPRSCRGWSAPR